MSLSNDDLSCITRAIDDAVRQVVDRRETELRDQVTAAVRHEVETLLAGALRAELRRHIQRAIAEAVTVTVEVKIKETTCSGN